MSELKKSPLHDRHEALGAKFARAKNTAQTRGAVRSQVILELERKLASEIITGYGEVTVQPLEEAPTVCLVTFSFTVAQGLNQIWRDAKIRAAGMRSSQRHWQTPLRRALEKC